MFGQQRHLFRSYLKVRSCCQHEDALYDASHRRVPNAADEHQPPAKNELMLHQIEASSVQGSARTPSAALAAAAPPDAPRALNASSRLAARSRGTAQSVIFQGSGPDNQEFSQHPRPERQQQVGRPLPRHCAECRTQGSGSYLKVVGCRRLNASTRLAGYAGLHPADGTSRRVHSRNSGPHTLHPDCQHLAAWPADARPPGTRPRPALRSLHPRCSTLKQYLPGGMASRRAASWNSATARSKAAPPYSRSSAFGGCGSSPPGSSGHCRQ